jgi:hypothetical protein
MSDNARLAKELEDAQLDLDDAKRSRRDLQHQLNIAMQRMDQSTLDADSMRVRCSPEVEPLLIFLQNRNPYIQVLIDGDGMIVSFPRFSYLLPFVLWFTICETFACTPPFASQPLLLLRFLLFLAPPVN